MSSTRSWVTRGTDPVPGQLVELLLHTAKDNVQQAQFGQAFTPAVAMKSSSLDRCFIQPASWWKNQGFVKTRGLLIADDRSTGVCTILTEECALVTLDPEKVSMSTDYGTWTLMGIP